jgi:peptide/nickel transport system substrate-binding protein
MKKLMSILLCCLMILGMAACGGGDKPGGGSAGDGGESRDTVKIGIDGDCGTLDPYLISGSYLNVMYNYAEPLWSYDGVTDGFASDFILAESVDTISDTEYVIHLREGVTFSNGSPFTADDVIFSLEYVANESNIAYYITFVDMEKTVAEDDYTVRLFLTAYDKTQLTGLANVAIVDKETYDPDTSGHNPIGTGPYVVKDYVVNSTVTLEARDDYWGGDAAIKNIVFKNIPEAAQKVNALETGEVDMLISCPTADVEYVQGLDGVDVIMKGSISQVNLTYNCYEGGPLSTKEARWAVSHAVNSAGILDVALNGYGEVAKAAFSASCGDYSDDLADLHDTYSKGYDLELAKKYAEESGLVGKTVTLITNGTEVYVTAAQIIEQALKEIGVNAQVLNSDQATVRNTIAGEEGWDVYVSWISNPSGIGLDQLYGQVCKFGRAHINWDTELFSEFDAMGKELLATADDAKYNELLVEFMTKFEEQCFMYGVADMPQISAAYDYIGGIATEGFATERVFDWYFK